MGSAFISNYLYADYHNHLEHGALTTQSYTERVGWPNSNYYVTDLNIAFSASKSNPMYSGTKITPLSQTCRFLIHY